MLIEAIFAAALATSGPQSVVVDGLGPPPKGWTVIDQPRNEDEWRCSNYSQDEWAVDGKSVHDAVISPYEHAKEVTLELAGGRLIGTNHGEFGGRVEWEARGSLRRVLVASANPVALTRRGNDVFVATGLAHLTLNSGEVLRLRRSDDDSWQLSKVIDLGEAPNAAFRKDETTWIVLTTNGVTRVDLSALTKQQIYRNGNWWLLYGNSIAPLGNSWLIGARRAVIRLTPSAEGYREEWLAPDSCKRITGPGCDCQAN
ncbi:hypothetical protein J2X06_000515 [Lysobacter niastensis]|uniref:Uncharacterized protein n=1 Tax=Lysobacter niastensis TaxID=380629 RepID=A0ABU1W6X0_9GAMM|nr:hypothetical protein [Lysobacter niastensis]MDR7133331.1 hypothetical protein [Lysobacter niastensis]